VGGGAVAAGGVSVAQVEIGWGPRPTDPSPLELRFQTFHAEHPEVFDHLVAVAREKLAARRRRGRALRLGAKALVEAVRWHEDDDDAPGLPDIDNSLVSRYARLMARTCPDLEHVFEMRELNS